MTGDALRATLAETGTGGIFAVVANLGTTNAGAIDELDAAADVCAELQLWLHIDAAYGGAMLCAPSTADARRGFERADSFGIGPHKWLFAPYDCAALVYRDPRVAAATHAQHGTYLDMVSREEWNPSDFAFHLSRRAWGLPLWFSLATHGTDAYAEAVETTLDVARAFAREVDRREGFTLLLEPELSVVLFEVDGWPTTPGGPVINQLFKRTGVIAAFATAGLGITAGTAAAQPIDQDGLVNVVLTDTTLQVPVALAANICGVAVNVVATQFDGGNTTCDAFADAGATNNQGGRDRPVRQNGLINLVVDDLTIQVPIAVAANLCDISLNVLAQQVEAGPTTCKAEARGNAQN